VVVRYTKCGLPAYIGPPYTKAEKEELFKGLNDTPTVVGRYRKPQGEQPKKESDDGLQTER
jgi:hypothetical protein